MKCLIASLCVIALAALPAAASANAAGEAVSTKPIVIAYIPEHLQQRIPGHQHKPSKSEVQLPQYAVLPNPEAREQQERKRRVKIGVSVSLVVVAVGVGALVGTWKAFENSFE
jgi:hypothetical protein